MFFVGSFPLMVDSRSRVPVPYPVRERMKNSGGSGAFYVTPGRRPGTLMLFPDEYFEKARPCSFATDRTSDATYTWTQFEYSQCMHLTPDEQQGRLTIPAKLLERAGLGREVMLVGVHDHLEVWDRKQYEEFEDRFWQEYTSHRDEAINELRAIGAVASGGRPADAGVGSAVAPEQS